MLKVECESCKAPYQVDERRVPATGLKMRCPKCGHTFLVTDPSKGAASAGGDVPGGGPVAKPATKKATMVGVGMFQMPPPPGAAKPPPAAPQPVAPKLDDDFGLPAVKPAAPKPGAPRPVPIAAAKPAPPPPAALPGLDDLDLPAVASDAGLPAPAARNAPKAPAPKPPPAAAPAPPKPAPLPPSFGSLDLPAAKSGDLPSPKGAGSIGARPAPDPSSGGFGAIDLPAAKLSGGGFGAIDLPAAKPSGGGFGAIDLPAAKPSSGGFGSLDLPAAKPSSGGFGDLPSVSHAGGHLPVPKTSGTGGGFGDIDLPSLQNDLPQHLDQTAHLPAPMGAQAHLPAAMGNQAHLPAAMGAQAHLPAPMGAQAHLPSLGGNLPSPMGAQAHMPSPVSDDRLLPNRGGPSPVSFGELDLPLVGGGSVNPPPPTGGNAVSFGELDLPVDPSIATQAPQTQGGGMPGGMSFGEVDLGGGGLPGEEAPLGPPPAATGGNFAFQEASLEAPKPAMPMPGKQRPPPVDRPSSKLPKILALVAVLLVVGGAALQFTPVGAFGYIFLSDKTNQGNYAKQAQAAGDTTRQKLAADQFVPARAASDELFEAKKRAPRNRHLAGYTAFVEYMNEVRFGTDSSRSSRARTLVQEVPVDANVPYHHAALAAQDAAAGEWAKAKAAVATAQQKEAKDGIQLDLTILRGEIALAERDAATALSSFEQANATSKSARTQWGIARAHYLAKTFPKAKEAAEATLIASPGHAGALTMKAMLAWEAERDDVGPLKEISSVLDARKNHGPADISSALAAKGWILVGRDRPSDARAAFDEAVQVDPRNAYALVGQGEMLYAESRFTEALTRFDEALTKDPGSLLAVLGSAKSKISLERLADAKAQLTGARAKWPQEMAVAMWLARTEDALGNRKVAEELYNSAIELADPKNPEAIQVYAAYARFLAAQGRVNEAQAKLEQARSKLPDSAALRRAFGDVALAQGQYDIAIQQYESVIEKTPNDIGTRFRLGVAYRKANRLDKAAQELDMVAAADTSYPGIALERGTVFQQSGDLQKALEQFEGARQKAPNDPDLSLRVGAAYVAAGDIEKALPLLKKVLEQRPNSAEANHFVGRAYLRLGGLEIAAAMRYLTRAVDLDPNQAEYHLYVAWAANEASPAQLGLARKHVDKALSLDKLLADGYWQRGVVELREGQVVDAVKDLRRALELKPTRHEAHAALAESFEQKNDLRSASGEWAKAIAGDPKPALWRFRYGKLLAESGKSADAVGHLTYAVTEGKAAQPRPGWLGSAAFEAGEVLKKTGKKKEACENYSLYMELAPTTSPDRKDALRAMDILGCPREGR